MKLQGLSDRAISRIAKTVLEDEGRLLTMTLQEFINEPVEGFRYDPNLLYEANANTSDLITLGSGFFNLHPEGRKHVLGHEKAHYFVDYLQSTMPDFWDVLWSLVDEGAFGKKYEDGTIDGINGQFTPIENLTEAVIVYFEEPKWLDENYPRAYAFVSSMMRPHGLSGATVRRVA